MRRIKPLHLFWKRIALINHVYKEYSCKFVFHKLVFRKRPRKKCIWKRICQIHQIRWIKYKYKYKYMVWNLIKYKYKYKYGVFVFVFVFANTNTYLTPALVGKLVWCQQLSKWGDWGLVRTCFCDVLINLFPEVINRSQKFGRVQTLVVVVTSFSNIIHEQNTSNTNLTNKAYPGYCKHVLCWRPPEKALAYLAGGNKNPTTYHLHRRKRKKESKKMKALPLASHGLAALANNPVPALLSD